MKKLLAIVVLGLLWCNALIAEEYPNSWKLDIHCKQGTYTWYESAFVVNVENNEFTIGPLDRWGSKDFVFKGKIENKNIKINETWVWKNGKKGKLNYTGEFINSNEAILKGTYKSEPDWKCNARFFKVDRAPHFTHFKYLSEATEEIIKFTSYNPGVPLTIINGSYVNSPVEVSGKLILPKEGDNLPVVVFVHSSGGPSEFTRLTQSWRNDIRNQLLKNNIGIFEIDNFTGRGAKETATNQGKVAINAGELDALVAYKILDKHPRVNAKKLGITGHSRGGTASNMVVEKKFSDVVLGEENYYLASLPMAADCYNIGFENPTPTPAKILFLMGGADDYTLAKYCVKYVEKMKKAGGDVEIIVKKGWHHNFYSDKPEAKCSGCVQFNKCQVHFPEGWILDDEGFISNSLQEPFSKFFKMDLEKWRKKFIKASSKPQASNKLYRKLYVKMYKKCGEKGTTVGGDHGKETVNIAVPFFVNALK
mgnify:CR=1 FL=1